MTKTADLLWNEENHPIFDLAKTANYDDPTTKRDRLITNTTNIIYRWFNDGDRVGDRNAETVCYNVAEIKKAIGRRDNGKFIREALEYLKGARVCGDDYYEAQLARFADAVVDYCEEYL